MKKLALSIVDAAGALLPERAWRLIWKTMLKNDGLMSRDGWQYLGEIARRLEVDRVGVLGDYGLMISSPQDAFILREYAKQKRWAATTNALIREFFKDDRGTYFDIGANIGMTTIPLALSTDVVCHAFEPEPTNFANLMANLRINCANATAHQIALFDRSSTISFELSDSNLGDHRIRINGGSETDLLNEQSRKTIEVPCARLDDLNIPTRGPFLVKIDTQGAEPFIVSGGRNTLAKAEMILTEWAPYLMRRMSGDPQIIIDFFRSNFSHGSINQGEGCGPSEPIERLCERLSISLTSFKGMEYADVIARR